MAAHDAAASVPSRRSLLRAGLAGLAGLALGALGRPSSASAAAGGPIVMGASNDAGTSNTTLSTSSTGTALQVNQNSTGTALRGVAGNGIAGFFTSANGSGVSGVVAAKDKYGVYGGNDAATTGIGAAIRANGKQNHGLVATTASGTSYAVKAANSGTGYAVLGLGNGATEASLSSLTLPAAGAVFAGTNGVVGAAPSMGAARAGVEGVAKGGLCSAGVFGTNNETGAEAYGVRGAVTSSSSWAAGVYGMTTVAGSGVRGYGAGTSGIGVYGQSVNQIGVFGEAQAASGMCYGVYGKINSPAGYALYGAGNSHVEGALSISGTVSKGAGSFKIDHPLDPANKYLYHSFVESPDMLNVYSGTVTLDAAGAATVELPAWFEALNRDFRYQLTPIGPGAPDLHVSSKVHAGRFSIGGGKPGQEISWLLTGIRHDAFAEAHRIPVEQAKPEGERGLYLHPLEHGEPEAKGIGAAHSSGLPMRGRAAGDGRG